MKKTLLFAGMLIALSASVAAADGVNLGWGLFCPTLASSMVNVTDPCDGSTGATYAMIGSLRPAINLPIALAEEFSVDLQESSPVLSDYWHLEDENQPGQINPAGCRGTNSVTLNTGSLAVGVLNGLLPTSAPCVKFWGTSASGGINYTPGIGGPNRARLDGHFAKSPGSAMAAGTQYYSFIANIDTNHQNGIDAAYGPPSYICQGCQDGVCIVFNQVIVRQPPNTPGGDLTIGKADVRQFVTWQSAVGNTQCPGATPTHKATWGQVKSLYR